MKISRFNHEGYHDPTPYLAFQNIPDPAKEAEKEKQRRDRLARYRPIVYICSPYAGDVKANVLNARRYCHFAVQKDCIPIASHLFFPQFMDDNDAKQRDLGLYMATVLLTKCSEVWVFGRRISSGMASASRSRAVACTMFSVSLPPNVSMRVHFLPSPTPS